MFRDNIMLLKLSFAFQSLRNADDNVEKKVKEEKKPKKRAREEEDETGEARKKSRYSSVYLDDMAVI